MYKAKRKGTENLFGVKAFTKADILEQTKGVEGLYNEVVVMKEYGDNKHLMNFYELHETVHSLYMVVEYMSGGELLKSMSKKKCYSEKRVKKIMKNIILGLEAMHKLGLMHRDLKPENLMVKSSEEPHNVKIIDFGLAEYVANKEYIFNRCGTPGFVAPEIIVLKPGERYNEKCDVFSVGVIFYIL